MFFNCVKRSKRAGEIASSESVLPDPSKTQSLSSQEAFHEEFVPAGHFYSAIPNLAEALKRYKPPSFEELVEVPGIKMNLAEQKTLLSLLEPTYSELPFRDYATESMRYGYLNDTYSYGDAVFLNLMLRRLRPRQIIEVGSGHSSACTLDTVEEFFDWECSITFIEPYADLLHSLLRPSDFLKHQILTEPVQDIPISTFEQLNDRDILFIDSTHVSKFGSDVNFLMFEVIPRLKPGVVVHFHDIFPGFEYPLTWLQEGRVWQENYLLRSFLQFNSEFEVMLWPVLLYSIDAEQFAERFPVVAKNPGGSIYIRRLGGSEI